MSGTTHHFGQRRPARAGLLAVAAVVAVGMMPAVDAAAAHRAPGGRPDGSLAVSGVISALAGGPGGPALATRIGLRGPCGVSFAAGSMYIADGGSVRQVSQGTGFLTTPAGTGAAGPAGEGRLATRADLSTTCGTALDHAGNLVIADYLGQRVRVVPASTGTFYGQAMAAGHIYTVAGDGIGGFSGDGGPATAAMFDRPMDVAVDAAGNLLIPDFFNERIRVVAVKTGTFYGQAMTAGDIYTVAGGGHSLGDGGPATRAVFREPTSVALDTAGNVVIADMTHDRIRVVAVKTGTFYGQAMTAGDIYTVAGNGQYGFGGDGGPGTSARLAFPQGVAVDGNGNVLIADSANSRVRVVAGSTGTFYGQAMTAGDIYTVAGNGRGGHVGDGGPATKAQVGAPVSVAVDAAGNVLIADSGSYRIRAVAESGGSFYGKAMIAGDIYTVAGNGDTVWGFSGDRGAATRAEFGVPNGVAVDGAGNVVIADQFNNRIRVVAASTGTFYGQAMTAGHVYTVAGTGAEGFSGDGGPAASAGLDHPARATVDGGGNLVIADTADNRVRVVAARTGTFYGQAMTAGHIYTVAGTGAAGFSGDGGPATSAELNSPWDAATDAAGNLVIADRLNGEIRLVAARTGTFYGQAMTAGHIYTVAGDGVAGFGGDGGPATSASIFFPQGVATDGAGNLVIADSGNNRVRVVAKNSGTFYGQAMTAGDIYTVAGAGPGGFSGDGGPGVKARLSGPAEIAADGAGNLVIADSGNNRIRVVAAATGTFYGTAMTTGNIYTVAGSAAGGLHGDGGPATKAGLSGPDGVAIDSAGNLVIADTGDDRIRAVSG